MKCPVCAAELIHDTRDMPYIYKDETTIIPAVTADFCPACGESITDMTETERVMREMRAFSKQVNPAYVDPDYLAKVAARTAKDNHPIENEAEYRAALKVVSALVDADPKRGTPDGDRLEVLGKLVEAYENHTSRN